MKCTESVNKRFLTTHSRNYFAAAFLRGWSSFFPLTFLLFLSFHSLVGFFFWSSGDVASVWGIYRHSFRGMIMLTNTEELIKKRTKQGNYAPTETLVTHEHRDNGELGWWGLMDPFPCLRTWRQHHMLGLSTEILSFCILSTEFLRLENATFSRYLDILFKFLQPNPSRQWELTVF